MVKRSRIKTNNNTNREREEKTRRNRLPIVEAAAAATDLTISASVIHANMIFCARTIIVLVTSLHIFLCILLKLLCEEHFLIASSTAAAAVAYT